MKKVRFNVSTSVRMISDDKYHKEIERLDNLERDNYEEYCKQISKELKCNIKQVTINDEVIVPDWYYEKNKDVTTEISKYSLHSHVMTDGKIVGMPFIVDKQYKHFAGIAGDENPNKLTVTVKKLELLEHIENDKSKTKDIKQKSII